MMKLSFNPGIIPMLVRESFTVFVAPSSLLAVVTGGAGAKTPLTAPLSDSSVGGTSSSNGISKTAEHSVHSAISPQSSIGTENTALQPGHAISISVCGIFQTPDIFYIPRLIPKKS
jgi:hypothetical protein